MKYVLLALMFLSFNSTAELLLGGGIDLQESNHSMSIEYTKGNYYLAADFGNQPFLRGGMFLLDNGKAYVKMGLCLTDKTDRVSSYLMFNPAAGIRFGPMTIEWSHCSNAGLSGTNYGYDALKFSWPV